MACRGAVVSAIALLSTLGSKEALGADESGGEKDQCINAADQGQQFRDENKYRVARDAFTRCANESCPALVKQECSQWLREIDEQSPTVVFGAQDNKGDDLTDVEITMDDAPLISKLDGKPTLVDPGEHVFHYEATGFSPIEERIVIRAGEKNRVIKTHFQAETPSSSEAEASTTTVASASQPAATWIFGGLALAAFASEAFFGLSGLGDRGSDLAPGGCAPRCGDSEKSSIQTKFIVADVSLGVGLVSAGLATYFFFASRASKGAAAAPVDTAVYLTPRPGGGVATVGGHF